MYRIEIFDDRYGFIFFDDDKANEDSAVRIADVTSQSRKTWMRVVHAGKVIAEYDRRIKTQGVIAKRADRRRARRTIPANIS